MVLSESKLRHIIRKILIEKGGRAIFHGYKDQAGVGYAGLEGPIFSNVRGQIPEEDIALASDWLEENDPSELLAYSRGGAMVQELPDEEYSLIDRIKYVAPAAKRDWTSKPIKRAPAGSEMWIDSADSAVPIKQACQIASEAGIDSVNVWHNVTLRDKVGKPRFKKDGTPIVDSETGEQKMYKWRGVGLGVHHQSMRDGADNRSPSIKMNSSQCAKDSNLPDWGHGKAPDKEVELQWNYVDSMMETHLRELIYSILSEKKEVKCPRKNGKRDYKCEYQKYGGASKKGKKDRAARNQARKVAEREGRVKKGDGKEIDHKKPLSKGGSNVKSNQRVVSRSTNRKKGNKSS